MKEPKEHHFVTHLEKLRDAKNRAALACLRRGLGKKLGTPEMFPYVVPYLPDSPREREHYFLVAALFAMHPAESPRGTSLGKTFKGMWDGSDSLERRFTNLLSADPEDIGGHLRQAVSLAKSRNAPIDYHLLLNDLKYWNHPDRFVQLNWARDFWGHDQQQTNDNSIKGEDA